MKKLWRYLNYDMIDTCLLSLAVILLIKCFISEWFEISPYILAGISFGVLYISGVIWRMGMLKDIMNESIRDEEIRRSLGMNIYANRGRPIKRGVIPWLFLTAWILALVFSLLIV